MSTMPGIKKKFNKGEVIIAEGTDGKALYYIQSGKVEVSKNGPYGQIPLAHLGPNDIFGEMSLILDEFGKRSATVRAVEPTEILILDRKGFDQYMEKAPPGLQNIVKRLAQRLRETNDLVCMSKRNKSEISEADSKDSNALTYDQMATAKESAVDLNLIPKKFKKDQVLIRQDADAMSVFLLKQGAVKITRKESDRIYELDELTINETFGEMSMFDENGKRFANVIALDDGEAVVFSRKDMEQMLRKAPLELLLIMESLCQKLKRSVGRYISTAEKLEKLEAENRKLKDRITELESQVKTSAEKHSRPAPENNAPSQEQKPDAASNSESQ